MDLINLMEKKLAPERIPIVEETLKFFLRSLLNVSTEYTANSTVFGMTAEVRGTAKYKQEHMKLDSGRNAVRLHTFTAMADNKATLEAGGEWTHGHSAI